MKKRLKIGIDCDDVLFECNSYSISCLLKEIPDAKVRLEDIKNWTENGPVLNARVKFFRDPDFIRNMPLSDGAQLFVKTLDKVADVYFITSVNVECMTARAEALKRYFPEISEKRYIFTAAKDLVELDLLLDDAPHNILCAERVGIPVLFRRPWNSQLSGLPAVDSYAGFLHIVEFVRNSYTNEPPVLDKGGIICVVGLPGSGKASVVEGISKEFNAQKILSYTTRKNIDDRYRSVTEDGFIKMKPEFIQTSVYGGDSYGIRGDDIANAIGYGGLGVVALDICGAISLKSLFPQTVILFADVNRDVSLADIIEDERLSTEQKVCRINGLVVEAKNRQFADYVITEDTYREVMKKIIKKEY